jgi:hypothetical protein
VCVRLRRSVADASRRHIRAQRCLKAAVHHGRLWVELSHSRKIAGNSAGNWRYRPLCASIDYVHENVGDPVNKPRTRLMLHIILEIAVVILSLPARRNCLLRGLQGQRSKGDLEMHLSWISRRCRVQWHQLPARMVRIEDQP